MNRRSFLWQGLCSTLPLTRVGFCPQAAAIPVSKRLFSPAVRCHTCLMRTMVSARLPNALVARMDQVGPRSAVIVAALRAYLRRQAPRRPARASKGNQFSTTWCLPLRNADDSRKAHRGDPGL